jgi:hypothetical protein
MTIKENLHNLFKPRAVKNEEYLKKLSEAHEEERRATSDYLLGKISIEQYHERLEKTHPITGINLRRVASKLNYR